MPSHAPYSNNDNGFATKTSTVPLIRFLAVDMNPPFFEFSPTALCGPDVSTNPVNGQQRDQGRPEHRP
jgi:hypothetical protein